MKNRKWQRFLAFLAVVAFITAIPSAQAKLKVGDTAPKLQPGKWVQGGRVEGFEPGKVYVVEFWATWCGTCRVTIPHLNDLAKKFHDQGLVVIGQSVWENEPDAVAPYIKIMGDKMTYHVATDDKTSEKEGIMASTWMKAAGQSGLPTAFIIEKTGRIAWIGHPMEVDEKLIRDLLADRYDLAKATADYERNDRNQQILLGWSEKLDQQSRAKDWAAALATLGQMEKLVPERDRPGVVMSRFQVLLLQKDFPAAYKTASTLSDTHPDDPQIQNMLAWTIATMDGLEKRDLPLAEKFAGRAVEASKGADSNFLDTLARVEFMNGKKSLAIKTEKRAVAAAEERDKDLLRKTLASYEKGKLPELRD